MPRRKGPVDRPAQRESLIAAATDLVAKEGVESLTARRLAKAIGYSLGHIYNIFPDLSTLTLAVNERTLARLHQSLSAAKGLHDLAETYLRFAAENMNLWNLALTHRLTPGEQLPENYAARIAALPDLVLTELKTLFPAVEEKTLRDDVALLWSGLHGLSNLGLSGRLDLIQSPAPETLAKRLIDGYLAARKA